MGVAIHLGQSERMDLSVRPIAELVSVDNICESLLYACATEAPLVDVIRHGEEIVSTKGGHPMHVLRHGHFPVLAHSNHETIVCRCEGPPPIQTEPHDIEEPKVLQMFL
jgi:hypothetical protein